MKLGKHNNKGFSLIELIVTIAVIAIVVIPFLRSFFTAMSVNSDARKIQNATALAQDTVEEFKAKTVEDMISFYEDKGITVETTMSDAALDSYGRQYPKYVFNDIPMTGADSEDFFMTVTLDAVPYSAVSGDADSKFAVNSMTSPQFSSLFGSDVIMLFKQYTKPDNELEAYFRAKGTLTEAELAQIKPGKVTKSSDIDISCSYNDGLGVYTYEIRLEMTYSFNGDTVSLERYITKTYNGPENHAIYMMLPLYDNVTSTHCDPNGNPYSTDKLNISYNFMGAEEDQPELGLFIAQQDTNCSYDTIHMAKFKSENVKIDNGLTSTSLYGYSNVGKKFKVYTNIEKSTSDSGSVGDIQGLTYSEKSDSTTLYEIKVDVRYNDKDGDVLTTFTSSKED